jgi:hypothetical protein
VPQPKAAARLILPNALKALLGGGRLDIAFTIFFSSFYIRLKSSANTIVEKAINMDPTR